MNNLKKMLAQLSHPDEDLRRKSVEALSRSDKLEAVHHLIIALTNPSIRIREAAMEAICTFEPDKVCRVISPLLASEDTSLRNYIIEILEVMGNAAEPFLIDATQSKDADVKKFALDILIKLAIRNGDHSEAARNAVLGCFSDNNPNVAGSAIEAMGYSNNKDYIPLCLKMLRSESPWIQCAALSSLMRLAGQDAEKHLVTTDRSKLSEEATILLNILIPGEQRDESGRN